MLIRKINEKHRLVPFFAGAFVLAGFLLLPLLLGSACARSKRATLCSGLTPPQGGGDLWEVAYNLLGVQAVGHSVGV